jgi:hypothetical protein
MAGWNGNGLIGDKTDVLAALQRVNAQAQTRATTSALAHAAQTGEPTTPDPTRVLPADPSLLPLLPWSGGIRRGTTIAATGSTSLLMLLLAGAMQNPDSWCAIVGMPTFGVLAAAEHGCDTTRLALIPDPGPDWPSIVASLLDGIDLVVVAPPAETPAIVITSLAARARKTGAVLIPTTAWRGADLVLTGTDMRWHGLRQGRGRLKRYELEVTASGRGKAHRPRTATLSLPHWANRPPVRIPPPQFVGAAAHRADNSLWEHVEPSPPPADPWAALRQ